MSGTSGPEGLVRFSVAVERGLPERPAAVAGVIEQAVFDHRGWGANGARSFQRVERRAAIRIVLASPAATNRLCGPLPTVGVWSCFWNGTVVLNHYRWQRPPFTYAGRLAAYRTLMVQHELGHALGYFHGECATNGALASVMMQQGMGLDGCRANVWPQPLAPRLPASCTLRVERVEQSRVLRLTASVRWIGTATQAIVETRVDGGWQSVATMTTNPRGDAATLTTTDAGVLRLRFAGTMSRLPCSAIATTTPRITADAQPTPTSAE